MLNTSTVARFDKAALKNPKLTAPSVQRLTEVIIPSGQNSNAVILPLVANLSRQSQQNWVTWITDRKPTKAQLSSYEADTHKLRIIHTNQSADSRWIIWEALAAGNSHTVIADSASISHQDIHHMEAAAAIGNCQGIITCTST